MFGEIGCLLEIPRTANVRVLSETATIFSCSYSNLIAAVTPGDKPFTELIKSAHRKYNQTLGPGERSESNINNMLEIISPYLLKTCPTISESSRKFVAANARIMTYKKGEIRILFTFSIISLYLVYRKGDPGNYFYILMDGTIDLCKINKSSKKLNSNLRPANRRNAIICTGSECLSIQDSLIKFDNEINSQPTLNDYDNNKSQINSLLFQFDTFGIAKLPPHLEILKNVPPPKNFNVGVLLPDLISYEFNDAEVFLEKEPTWTPIRQIFKSDYFGDEGIYNQSVDTIRLNEYENSIKSLEILINKYCI